MAISHPFFGLVVHTSTINSNDVGGLRIATISIYSDDVSGGKKVASATISMT